MSNLNIPESAVADYNRMQDRLSKEAYQPTDAELIEWALDNKTYEDWHLLVIENTNWWDFGVVLKAVFSEPIKREPIGVMNQWDFRDVAVCKTMRNTLLPFIRKYWGDECSAWFDNQEAE